jgi:glycosyltransferase involved in cell wall biosynthesis
LDPSKVVLTRDLTREQVLKELGLPSQRRFVTIVANMRHEIKDHPMFLRMAKRVHEAVPDAAFVLAGEGELVDELKAMARELGIEKETFFIGRCLDVPELLSISDICVLTSKAEGFSNSILEYMAARRPVVATNVGGAAEAIVQNETGYLVNSGDDEEMARYVIGMLRDSAKARRMGERGQEVVSQRFSAHAQLTNTTAMYEKVLAGSRRMIPQPVQNNG